MRTRPAFVRLLVGVGLLLLFCAPLRVGAQDAATLKAFQTEPHLGTFADALVGLIVTNKAQDGSLQTRHGNGLILRCDGFVLAPADLFNTRNIEGQSPNVPNQSVAAVLHPGTAKEQRVVGHRPNWYGFLPLGNPRCHLRYAVFKLDNVHVPTVPALLPDSLHPNDPVQVVWSAWDEAAQHFQPVQTTPAIIGERAPQPPTDKTPAKYLEQVTPLVHKLEGMTPGAVVIGPDNMAVGIIPGRGVTDVSYFANFDSLHLATNCITALPTSNTAFMQPNPASMRPKAQDGSRLTPGSARKQNNGKMPIFVPVVSTPDMVEVAGGPVQLPPYLLGLQLDMERSKVACVAPFLIDRYEVTNEQYLAFWKSLPDKQRRDAAVQYDMYPIGWGSQDAPFPPALAQVPVLGVRLPGARAYAKWAGKRLPTPYEWCLAAFGPTGGNVIPEWGRKFIKQRHDIAGQIADAHQKYAREHPEILPHLQVMTYMQAVGNSYTMLPSGDGNGGYHAVWDTSHPIPWEFFRLPWYFIRPEYTYAAEWSRQKFEELMEPLFTEWVDPMYVLPVGSRPYDVSPYGAFDMVMNAEELIAPAPFYPWNKPPANHWPNWEADRYMHINWTFGDVIERTGRRLGAYPELVHMETGASVSNQMIVGSTSTPAIQSMMANPEAALLTSSFYDNNMGLWQNMPQIVTPGFPTAGLVCCGLNFHTQLSASFGISEIHANLADHSADLNRPSIIADQPFDPLACLWENGTERGDYTVRMLSRRIHSASENARPGSSDYFPNDLGAYANVCATMDEYSELLRPVDTMEVGLRVGPTYNMYYYPAGVTTFHHWIYEQQGSVDRQKGHPPRVTLSGQTFEVDKPQVARGTAIGRTGSVGVWSGQPKHYHAEMGRPVGVDHANPAPPDAKIGYPVPDTFLVPGGFRCAR